MTKTNKFKKDIDPMGAFVIFPVIVNDSVK